MSLNGEQENAISEINRGRNVFITGDAGTGKSYLLHKLIEDDPDIIITSTTAISALLIKGKTIHSWSGIGYGRNTVSVMIDNIKKKSYLLNNWRNAKKLVIDEISMLSGTIFNKLNQIAKIIRNNKQPFGGIQIILVGDFCQLPVVKNTDDYCFKSVAWKECNLSIINLKQIMRQSDLEFTNLLQKVRMGNVTIDIKKKLNSRVGLWNKDMKTIDGIKPTLLYSTNKDIKAINDRELNKLIEENKHYNKYNVDIKIIRQKINNISANNIIQKHIEDYDNMILTTGAQIMLTKNIDKKKGLVNGCRGVVVDFDTDNNPIIKFIDIENKIVVNKYTDLYVEKNFQFEYTHYPIKLAWATTIHKSQGSTLNCVVINLSNIFEYGQAYVALSRVKNFNNLYITGKIKYSKIKIHPDVKKFYENI